MKGQLGLHVDRMAFGHFGSFLDHLRQSWVSVDGGFDLIPCGFEVHGETNLCDQFGALAAHHVCSDDFTVRFTVDDFHEALGFSCGQSFATGLVGELADLVLETFFFRGAFGETDAGHLRMAVGAAREDTDFLRRVLGEHAFDGLHRLVASDVGEPRRTDDVTCAVDAFHRGLVACIGFQPATITQFQFNAARQDWGDTNRDQGNFCFEGFVGSAFDGDLDSVSIFAGASNLGVGEDANASLRETFLDQLTDLGVFYGQDVGLHLDDGHFRAVSIEEVSELNANGPCADDDNAFGLLGQGHCFPRTDDGGAVEGESWHRAAFGSSSDEDVRGVMSRLAAIRRRDFHFASRWDAGGAAQVVHLVLFEEEFDALVQLVGHTTAAANDFRPIKLQATDFQAKLFRPMAEGVIQFGVFQECFGGDTSPVEAGATGAVVFDTGDFFTELSSANGSDVARRPAADDDEVVVHVCFGGK